MSPLTFEALLKARHGTADIMDIRGFRFAMVTGGGPGSTGFTQALQALYSVSYGAQFLMKNSVARHPKLCLAGEVRPQVRGSSKAQPRHPWAVPFSMPFHAGAGDEARFASRCHRTMAPRRAPGAFRGLVPIDAAAGRNWVPLLGRPNGDLPHLHTARVAARLAAPAAFGTTPATRTTLYITNGALDNGTPGIVAFDADVRGLPLP